MTIKTTETKVYTQRTKNAFLKKHNLANLLPELNQAIQFDILQLLQRNSSEINKTLRIAALRSENDRLTDLGQQVLHYLLESIEGINWEKGRVALGKDDVKVKTDFVFTTYIEKARQAAAEKAEKDAKEKAEKAAEDKAKKEAAAAEKHAKAKEAQAIAQANKTDEKAQEEAAAAIFDAKAAKSKVLASDKNISVKAAHSMLHGIVAGNLKVATLQEINDTLRLLNLAAQAMARQAAKVPNVEADETRVEELSKTKATDKEKTADQKTG